MIVDILGVLVWPITILVILILFRNYFGPLINRLIRSETSEIKAGQFELKFGKLMADGQLAVDKLNRLNFLMAESRLLELQITEGMFGLAFSESQSETMKAHINELKIITEEAK